MDISDLADELNRCRTFAQSASFLCRDEDEVRQKARALRLTEHPGKRISNGSLKQIPAELRLAA